MKFSDASNDTSWGGVADWYDGLVEGEGSYQRELILPNMLRLVAPKAGMNILDVACGQGFFTRAFHEQGASVVGVDVGKELIEVARSRSSDVSADKITYHVSSADSMPFLKDASFDAATIVLALQNIERFSEVFAECSRVLKPAKGTEAAGTLVLVLNHPAFRIPSLSSWEFDEKKQIQYRRIDGYLGESKTAIDMRPGKMATSSEAKREKTISFHRPLQAYFKALEKSGFMVKRLEEWTSHKQSEKGPRQSAENHARKEFPLFLMIEAVKK